MKIKTSYDCTIEPTDMANLARGKPLSATLSDGSIAFRFQMDPELLQPGNGMRRVKGVVVDAPPKTPPMLTDGAPTKKYTHQGTCAYCKKGPYNNIEGHIRAQHPDKPLYPTGKFRCVQCIQRFATRQGLALHLRFTHKVKKGEKA